LNQRQKARQELDIAAIAHQQKILLAVSGSCMKTKRIGVGYAKVVLNADSNN
jgi:hypothetical protein